MCTTFSTPTSKVLSSLRCFSCIVFVLGFCFTQNIMMHLYKNGGQNAAVQSVSLRQTGYD